MAPKPAPVVSKRPALGTASEPDEQPPKRRSRRLGGQPPEVPVAPNPGPRPVSPRPRLTQANLTLHTAKARTGPVFSRASRATETAPSADLVEARRLIEVAAYDTSQAGAAARAMEAVARQEVGMLAPRLADMSQDSRLAVITALYDGAGVGASDEDRIESLRRVRKLLSSLPDEVVLPYLAQFAAQAARLAPETLDVTLHEIGSSMIAVAQRLGPEATRLHLSSLARRLDEDLPSPARYVLFDLLLQFGRADPDDDQLLIGLVDRLPSLALVQKVTATRSLVQAMREHVAARGLDLLEALAQGLGIAIDQAVSPWDFERRVNLQLVDDLRGGLAEPSVAPPVFVRRHAEMVDLAAALPAEAAWDLLIERFADVATVPPDSRVEVARQLVDGMRALVATHGDEGRAALDDDRRAAITAHIAAWPDEVRQPLHDALAAT